MLMVLGDSIHRGCFVIFAGVVPTENYATSSMVVGCYLQNRMVQYFEKAENFELKYVKR